MPETQAEGTLERLERGGGFLRSAKRNYAIHAMDPFVSEKLIQQFGLRGGETVIGPSRR